MYLRYVCKVGSTELCDGLYIKDKREADVKKNDSQFSGRCSWVDGNTAFGEGNIAGICLGEVHEENEFNIGLRSEVSIRLPMGC